LIMADVDQEFDELLSAYVDGELSADEEQRVRQRLEAEPQLVAASSRSAPTAAAARRCGRAASRMKRRCSGWSTRSTARSIGRRSGRYRLSKIPQHFRRRRRAFSSACWSVASRMDRGADRSPRLRPPATPSNPRASPPHAPDCPAQVRILDGRGQQVMIQRFNSVDEAQRFIQDLQQWQAEQEQIQNGGGAIVPATTERF
jgi:hypothetical protein